MGSKSDWAVIGPACETLAELGVPYEARVVSAHRTPDCSSRTPSGASRAACA